MRLPVLSLPCLALTGLLWAPPTAQAAAPDTRLQAAQVAALGIRSEAVQAAPAVRLHYPALVVLPPGQQRVVAAPVAGLVDRLQVSVGDAVRAGQPLVQLRSAQAQELQRDVLTSGSQAALAATALARDEQLYAEGLIPLARLEAARAQAQQARAQADERRRSLALAGAPVNGLLTLSAPISGVVLERAAAVGQRVEAGSALLRVGALGTLWVELQVPVAQAAGLGLGHRVQVLDTTASGPVVAIGAAVDGASQTVMLRAELRKPPPGLRIGQAIQVAIERPMAGLVQLPEGAVLSAAGQRQVLLETAPGQYRAQVVTVQGSAGGLATVQGLAPGSRVVVQGQAALAAAMAAAPAAGQP